MESVSSGNRQIFIFKVAMSMDGGGMIFSAEKIFLKLPYCPNATSSDPQLMFGKLLKVELPFYSFSKKYVALIAANIKGLSDLKHFLK